MVSLFPGLRGMSRAGRVEPRESRRLACEPKGVLALEVVDGAGVGRMIGGRVGGPVARDGQGRDGIVGPILAVQGQVLAGRVGLAQGGQDLGEVVMGGAYSGCRTRAASSAARASASRAWRWIAASSPLGIRRARS